MTIAPYDDRWVSFGQGNRWMVLEQDADRDGASDAALTMLLVNSDEDPETVLEGIVQQDRVQPIVQAAPTTMLGRSATSVDLMVEPNRRGCGTRIARFLNTGSYVALLNEGPNRTFGLPACRTTRVWVLTIDNLTLTIIGAVRHEDDFDLRMEDLERFLDESVQFGLPDAQPQNIDGQPTVWHAGVQYRSSSFVVPLTFSPDVDGFISAGATDSWVEIRYDVDLDGGSDGSVTFLAYEIDESADALIGEITAREGIVPRSDPIALSLGQSPTVRIDLEGLPDSRPSRLECSSPTGRARFDQSSGYELFTDEELTGTDNVAGSFGIPSCALSRLWLVDVTGVTITVIGVANNDDDFASLATFFEDFLQDSVTFGDPDG